MSLMKYTLAAVLLSASSVLAGETPEPDPAGAWRPVAAEALYASGTVLVINGAGRFAALVARRPTGLRHDDTLPLPVAAEPARPAAELVVPDELNAASGRWTIGEDGGEVVLVFDNPSAEEKPGSTLYLQMLLIDDELHPYPGTSNRSPIAGTIWRRAD